MTRVLAAASTTSSVMVSWLILRTRRLREEAFEQSEVASGDGLGISEVAGTIPASAGPAMVAGTPMVTGPKAGLVVKLIW